MSRPTRLAGDAFRNIQIRSHASAIDHFRGLGQPYGDRSRKRRVEEKPLRWLLLLMHATWTSIGVLSVSSV